MSAVHQILAGSKAIPYSQNSVVGIGFVGYDEAQPDLQKLSGFRGSYDKLVPMPIVYNGETSGKPQRDATIFKSNGEYWIIHSNYTIIEDFIGGLPSPFFIISKSRDLLTWNFVYKYQPLDQTAFIYSPQSFVDTDGKIYITFTSALDQNAICATYIVEIISLTATLPIFGEAKKLGDDASINPIDSCMIKRGSTYYLFSKNENTKYIQFATSNNPLNGFSTCSGDIFGIGENIEAPMVKLLINGDYRIYYEKYQDQSGFWYRDASSDDFLTWGEEKQLMPSMSNNLIMRHGDIIAVK